MVQSTPLNRFPVFQNSDPLDYGSQQAAVLRDVDSKAPPIFASAGARDIAYSTWVAAGNAMVDGLVCSVAGRRMIYRGGVWRGTTPEPGVYVPATRQLPLGRNDDVEDSFVQVTVPDPGYPYEVEVEAHVRTYANCELSIRVRGGNGAPDPNLQVVTNAHNHYNNDGVDVITPRRAGRALTGPSRLIGYAVRVAGTGDWNITSASLYYRVFPV